MRKEDIDIIKEVEKGIRESSFDEATIVIYCIIDKNGLRITEVRTKTLRKGGDIIAN